MNELLMVLYILGGFVGLILIFYLILLILDTIDKFING